MIEGVVRYANDRINHRETKKLLAQSRPSDRDTAPPSPRILRERQIFNAKCFKGGNQAQHAGDAIGQLWLVGLLDAKGLDETKLLDAARTWWRGREMTFRELGSRSPEYERASRTSNRTTKQSKLERSFARYEAMLKQAPAYDVEVLHDLMQPRVDGVPCTWAARLVQTEVLRHFILPVALLACTDDYDLLAAAKRALLVMVGEESAVEAWNAA